MVRSLEENEENIRGGKRVYIERERGRDWLLYKSAKAAARKTEAMYVLTRILLVVQGHQNGNCS